MGFASRGRTPLPRTFEACQKLWDDRRSKAKDYVTLASNTLLHFSEYSGVFYATFHGNAIVTYYPGYKTIDACGYASSPTTQDRLTRLTGACVHSNSRLGFDQPVRVGDYPYFAGMRIDNFGHVVEEDRKPDFKTRPIREWSLRYATLWKRIYKVLLARWELGEFSGERVTSWSLNHCQQALLDIEAIFANGNTFIPRETAINLIWGGTNTISPDLKPFLDHRKDSLRDWWLRRNDAYETIEVK